MRKMCIKSCYGNLFGTTKNIMLWEIMLWKDHVRRGLAVLDLYFVTSLSMRAIYE